MEDADGGFSFDFEGGLDAAVAANAAAPSVGGQVISTVAAAGLGQSTGGAPATGAGQGGRRNFRQTVCRHWLRGLCMKGEACGFLHQLDKSRMPICRFFGKYGECHEPDCGYKHSYEDVKECNMYKLGFCPNGPDCRYRHVKLPGPFPPLEESLQKIQLRSTAGQSRQSGRYLTQRQGYNTFEDAAQPLPSVPQPQPVVNGEDAQTAAPPPLPTQDVRQQKQPEEEVQLPPPPPLPPTQQRPPGLEQQTEYGQAQVQPVVQQTVSNGTGSQAQTFVSASSPLPQGFSRYFIVKSSNRENLELSVARGLWATHRNNEAKLNDAFDSCDNVILIFSVNETGHFQGCARMMSKIGVIVGGGGWKYAHGTAHYGRNFRLKWLKLCELSFNKTRHLRNPYKENLPVKISRDCQELEPSVGEKLASLFYMEPDSDLMKIAKEAELRWEEERARGLTSAQDTEDANIVPYEDNDEDQEDEDSDEDDSSNQTVGQSRRPNLGRGGDSLEVARRKPRGRGRSMSGDAYAVGYDRFVSGTSNGYKIPGMSAGRGFPPYQAMPRYAGPGAAMGFGHIDGPVLASGMVLSGRPPNGIFGHSGSGLMGPPGTALMPGVRPANVMGATRPHFIGVPGAGQHGRSGGLPFRPSQTSNWGRRGISEQQRRQRSESNTGGDRPPSSGEPRNVDKPVDQFPVEETYPQGKLESRALAQRQDGDFASESYGKDDDDSLSEDEAPRRSRYGEGKKRRRD